MLDLLIRILLDDQRRFISGVGPCRYAEARDDVRERREDTQPVRYFDPPTHGSVVGDPDPDPCLVLI